MLVTDWQDRANEEKEWQCSNYLSKSQVGTKAASSSPPRSALVPSILFHSPVSSGLPALSTQSSQPLNSQSLTTLEDMPIILFLLGIMTGAPRLLFCSQFSGLSSSLPFSSLRLSTLAQTSHLLSGSQISSATSSRVVKFSSSVSLSSLPWSCCHLQSYFPWLNPYAFPSQLCQNPCVICFLRSSTHSAFLASFHHLSSTSIHSVPDSTNYLPSPKQASFANPAPITYSCISISSLL